MRIVFAGTPEVAVAGLTALLGDPAHEIVGVITRQDAPVGRKRVLTPSPVAVAAEGIPTLKANRLGADELEWVSSLGADLGVVIAYGGLLKTEMLNAPRLGWINVHFSTLPRWRGAAPVQRALMAGETRLGSSVFRLVEELDAGAVLTAGEWDFDPGTTAGEALVALAELSVPILSDAISMLEADPAAGVEQRGETTYAAKLTRDDGRLDFNGGSAAVLAHWAGVTPEPGAWALDGDAVVKIAGLGRPAAEARGAGLPVGLAPGEARIHERAVYVGTGDDPLVLETVQPAGKKQMPAVDWLRGKGGGVTLK